MSTARSLFVAAYAKINLTLDVLGKRDDGYHALASVMQAISLHDTLLIRANTSGQIAMVCDDPALHGDDNLALRAAWLLKAETGDARLGAEIELRKAVPVQAGLGGGSSDAAAVLTTLNALWGSGYDAAHLQALGARLGSDVPFFIRGGTALIEGRGELVTPLLDAEPLWILLAKPRTGLSTAAVFGELSPAGFTDGAATRRVVEAIGRREPIAFGDLANALEPGVRRAFPEVDAACTLLLAAGAPVARMSGSGPTVFAPCRELALARAIYAKLVGGPLDVWLAHTVTSRLFSVPLPNS